MRISRRGACVLLLALALSGCAGSARTRIVTAANASGVLLVSTYKAMGDACVQKAASRTDAEACIASNDAKWAPVWVAFDALRAADGDSGAWCSFLQEATPLLSDYALPGVDGVECVAADGGAL